MLYRAGRWKLTFSPEAGAPTPKTTSGTSCRRTHKAGMILAYLDRCTGDAVCSKQLYREARTTPLTSPEAMGDTEMNEIMNQCVTGWELLFQPPYVPAVWQAKGLGNGRMLERHWQRGRENPRRLCVGHRTDGASILKNPGNHNPLPTPLLSRCPPRCREKCCSRKAFPSLTTKTTEK